MLGKEVDLPCLPPPGSAIIFPGKAEPPEGADICLKVYGEPSFYPATNSREVTVRAYLEGQQVELMKALLETGWITGAEYWRRRSTPTGPPS
jgi:hypothetical protein